MPGKWFLKSRRAAPRGDRESERGRGRGVLVKLPRLNGARKNLREKYVRGGLVRGRAGTKLLEERHLYGTIPGNPSRQVKG